LGPLQAKRSFHFLIHVTSGCF